MTSYYDRQVHAEAEKLKRSMVARKGRREAALKRGAVKKPKTVHRGETPTREDALPAFCQHVDDSAQCHRPSFARSPITKVPACGKHYQREYRAALNRSTK